MLALAIGLFLIGFVTGVCCTFVFAIMLNNKKEVGKNEGK